MRRGAPPVEIEVRASGAWRAFVAVLAALAMASVLAWVALDDGRRPSPGWWTVVALLSLACLALAAGLWPRSVGRLSFDGDGWLWQPSAPAVGAAPPAARAVRPRVAVDLGRLMLLHLAPEDPTDGSRALWLPLERRVDAPTWHAMRCALHDPRATLAAGGPAAAAERGLPR